MLQSETFQNPLTQLSRTAQAGFNKDAAKDITDNDQDAVVLYQNKPFRKNK